MTSTLWYYKKLLLRCCENYNSQLESFRINWNNRYVNLIDRLHKRRLNKFGRDGLDIQKAIMLYRKTENCFQKFTEIDTNSNITDKVNSAQNIPFYHPINLNKNNNILSDGLKSLCS